MGQCQSLFSNKAGFSDVLSRKSESSRLSAITPQSKAADHRVSLVMKQKRAADRRGDIYAESLDIEGEDPYVPVVVPKTGEEKDQIHTSIQHNFVFASLEMKDISEMVDAMTSKECGKGDVIIQEGDQGDYFYIVQAGAFDIQVQRKVVGHVGPGASFGELALLFNAPRAATVTASQDGRVWALDRRTFGHVLRRHASDQMTENFETLRKVPLLETLTEEQLETLAKVVQTVSFNTDERIITKGDLGNVLYIIQEGSVVCSEVGTRGSSMEELELTEGDYFGERALMTNEARAAHVTAKTNVTAMAVDRETFHEFLGPVKEVLDQNMGLRVLASVPILQSLSITERECLYNALEIQTFTQGDYIIEQGEEGSAFYIIKSGQVLVNQTDETGAEEDVKIATLSSGEYFGEMALLESEPRQANVIATTDEVECFTLNQAKFNAILGPLQSLLERQADERKLRLTLQTTMTFDDLEVLTTLGTGTFGRVKLVKHRENAHQVFALKSMQKAQIVACKQKHNVMNEKVILSQCSHPFILKLHQTFKDETRLYLLMELVQGGELFTYLHCQDRPVDYISEKEARFYASNVILAFEYLHQRNIVYRDLKPENLLIDETGYIRVADFGFAKVISNRTYTLCGTPEYLAPEIVLGKGHGKGVDYWAMGILIYEMVVGSSPFIAYSPNDQMQICRNIVNSPLKFPKHISEPCRDLISKLLVKDVTKRIGLTRGGIQAIKKHAFFDGVNWNALVKKEIEAPWIPTISDPLDTSNFEPIDEDEDELIFYDDGTNWDKDF